MMATKKPREAPELFVAMPPGARVLSDVIAALQEKLAEVTRGRDKARAQRDALVAALDDLLNCPFTVDAASVPACGIEAAPPYQVVGVMSVAWTRIQNAHKALAAVETKVTP